LQASSSTDLTAEEGEFYRTIPEAARAGAERCEKDRTAEKMAAPDNRRPYTEIKGFDIFASLCLGVAAGFL
jgi:hypothetical protein